MGGYGSGGANLQRITAEACVSVDAAQLKRAGMIRPARLARWPAYAALDVIAMPSDAPVLYFILTGPGQGRHEQVIRLSFTPCHYGRDRAWLHCPTCLRRVFRLFYYDPAQGFACRHCTRLTYDLRRERGFDRYQSQVQKARQKLDRWALRHHDFGYFKDNALTDGIEWDDVPNKPRWMRWKTYGAMAGQFARARSSRNVAYVETMRRMGAASCVGLMEF